MLNSKNYFITSIILTRSIMGRLQKQSTLSNTMDEKIKNAIAPAAVEINSYYLKIGEQYCKTIFILNYPRYLATGWISPVINMPELMDISLYFHPIESGIALKQLLKKLTQVEAQITDRYEK